MNETLFQVLAKIAKVKSGDRPDHPGAVSAHAESVAHAIEERRGLTPGQAHAIAAGLEAKREGRATKTKAPRGAYRRTGEHEGEHPQHEEPPEKRSSVLDALLFGFAKSARELSTEVRVKIPKKQFAFPSKAEGAGEKAESGNYPIHDLPHARNALARGSAHLSPEAYARLKAKVYSRYPELRKRKEEREGGEEMGVYASDLTQALVFSLTKEAAEHHDGPCPKGCKCPCPKCPGGEKKAALNTFRHPSGATQIFGAGAGLSLKQAFQMVASDPTMNHITGSYDTDGVAQVSQRSGALSR